MAWDSISDMPWLAVNSSEQATRAAVAGAQIGSMLVNNYLKGYSARMESDSQKAMLPLQTQSMQLANQGKQLQNQMSAWEQDQKTQGLSMFSDMQKQYGNNWDDAPMPANQYAAALVSAAQTKQSMTAAAQSKAEVVRAFNNDMNDVDPLDRSEIYNLGADPKTGLPTSRQVTLLSLAKERAKSKKGMEEAQALQTKTDIIEKGKEPLAEIAAQSRMDVEKLRQQGLTERTIAHYTDTLGRDQAKWKMHANLAAYEQALKIVAAKAGNHIDRYEEARKQLQDAYFGETSDGAGGSSATPPPTPKAPPAAATTPKKKLTFDPTTGTLK